MSAQRGQRTRLLFGGAAAEVSLLKTSGKPSEAQHETKRVLVETVPPGEGTPQEEAYREFTGTADVRRMSVETTPAEDVRAAARELADEDPLGEPPSASPMRAPEPSIERAERLEAPPAPPTATPIVAPGGVLPADTTGADLEPAASGADLFGSTAPDEPPVPAPTTVQQGAHDETGTWHDLTAELETIDARTRVDGLEVIACIASSSIPRERVREAHYVAGADPKQYKVLALLWRALRETDRAAAVRWSKKTAQALGIIVARGGHPTLGGGGGPAHLILLELEWAQNMREPSTRVTGPMRAEVSDREVASAIEFVRAASAGPSALNDLRDERLAKRAELLELARAGKLAEYVAPPEPMAAADADAELAEVLAAAASRTMVDRDLANA